MYTVISSDELGVRTTHGEHQSHEAASAYIREASFANKMSCDDGRQWKTWEIIETPRAAGNTVEDFHVGDQVIYKDHRGFDLKDPNMRGPVTSKNDEFVFVKFPNFSHGGVACHPKDLAKVGASEYDRWMCRVDEAVEAELGLSSNDLSDWGFMDAFKDGLNPEEAAREAMEASGYGG